MVLTANDGSRGEMNLELSPPRCCGTLHHLGGWKPGNSSPLNMHAQLWKAFVSWWYGVGEFLLSSRSIFLLGTNLQWVAVLLSSWHTSCVVRHQQGPWEALPRRAKCSWCAMLSSHLMHRAGASCCDMLVRSPTMFAEISVEIGPPLFRGGCWDWRWNLLERGMVKRH